MATSSYYTYGTNLRNKEYFTSTVNTSNGIKRYFSNIDAEIYFGNQLMEDIYEFSFSVEEKKFPVYSYNKFYPDIIVPGQRIVQGTFALNFTNGSYMRSVLENIDDSILNTSYFEEEVYNPSGDSKNRALWNKNFDITLGYGDYKSENPSYNATCQTICGVQINNMGKAISSKTGEPILEVYSFVAKDFIDEEINEYTNSTNNDNNTSNNTSENASESGSEHEIKYSALYHPGSPSYITVTIDSDDKDIDLDSRSQKATLEILDKSILNELNDDSAKIINLEKHASKGFYIAGSTTHSKLFKIIKARFEEDASYSVKCNMKYKIKKEEQSLDADIKIRLGDALIL